MNTMYFYDGHLGGIYASDRYLSYKDTYCEICGEGDNFLFSANTPAKIWADLSNQAAFEVEIPTQENEYPLYDGRIGFELGYITNIFNRICDNEIKKKHKIVVICRVKYDNKIYYMLVLSKKYNKGEVEENYIFPTLAGLPEEIDESVTDKELAEAYPNLTDAIANNLWIDSDTEYNTCEYLFTLPSSVYGDKYSVYLKDCGVDEDWGVDGLHRSNDVLIEGMPTDLSYWAEEEVNERLTLDNAYRSIWEMFLSKYKNTEWKKRRMER